LSRISEALKETNGVKVVKFNNADVVRSQIARDILTSIDRFNDEGNNT
jgi:phosphate starvation-inducible protein PhoH